MGSWEVGPLMQLKFCAQNTLIYISIKIQYVFWIVLCIIIITPGLVITYMEQALYLIFMFKFVNCKGHVNQTC